LVWLIEFGTGEGGFDPPEQPEVGWRSIQAVWRMWNAQDIMYPKKLFCHFREVNPTVIQMNMESKSAPISAMWKDLPDKWHHNMFHEVLRIELVPRGHQIHDVDAFHYPHNRHCEFRSADGRLGSCCHIIATTRPVCGIPSFKIEPGLILGYNFALGLCSAGRSSRHFASLVACNSLVN
jgi:hypothetical protein